MGFYDNWGTGSPQATTSLGVPLQNNGMNSQIDQPSAIAQQMWQDYLRQQAAAPPQQPYSYSAGASFGGTNAGSPVLPAPAPAAPAAAPAAPAPAGYGAGSNGQNPYLQDITNSLDATRKFALSNDLSRIRGSSNLAGLTGSLKQGELEGTAIGLSNQGYTGAVANLLGTDWTNQQNRNLQNDAQRNSFYLGNRQLDQSGARLGADLFTGGMSGEYDPLRNASSIYQPYTGYGTTTSNQSSGGGWQGALGGLLGGATLGRQMGWW